MPSQTQTISLFQQFLQDEFSNIDSHLESELACELESQVSEWGCNSPNGIDYSGQRVSLGKAQNTKDKDECSYWAHRETGKHGEPFYVLTFKCWQGGGVTKTWHSGQALNSLYENYRAGRGLPAVTRSAQKMTPDLRSGAKIHNTLRRTLTEQRKELINRLKLGYETLEAKSTDQCNYYSSKLNGMQLFNAKNFAPGEFPYLYISKQEKISAYPSKVGGLVIPVYKPFNPSDTPEIASFQWIFDPNPDEPDAKRKLFAQAPEGALKAAFAVAGDMDALSDKSPVIGVAEGYATGLTINHVTGYPILCALSLGNIESVVNWLASWYKGKIIIYGDNDELKGAGAKTAKAVREIAKKHGIYYCLPKVDGTEKGSDFNDVYLELGIEACREQLGDVYPKVTTTPTYISLEKSQDMIREGIKGWLDGKNAIIRATAGVGKTHLVVDELSQFYIDVANDGKRVEGYFPQIRLSREVACKLNACGVKAIAQCGREKTAEDGTPMCKRAKLVESLQYCGIQNIQSELCFDGIDKCPDYDTCAYQAQFKNIGDYKVVLKQHAMINMGRSKLEGPGPDYVFVDEKFAHNLIYTYDIPLDIILIPHVGNYDHVLDSTGIQEYDVIRKRLYAAMSEGGSEGGSEVIWKLQELGVSKEELKTALEAIDPKKPDVKPFYDDEDIARNIEAYRNEMGHWRKIRRILKAIIKDYEKIEASEPGAQIPLNHFSQIRVKSDSTRCVILSEYREPVRFGAPVLYIDADADRVITDQIFNSDERETLFIECNVKENTYIRQVVDSSVSSTQLKTERYRGANNPKNAQWKRITEEQALLYAQKGESTLVVGPQFVMDELAQSPSISMDETAFDKIEGDNATKFAGKIYVEHFNNLLGINNYKEVDHCIVVGRNQPGINELEDLGRALFHDKNLTLLNGQNMPFVSRCVQTKAGRVYEVMVQEHPDPHINALLMQMRESNSTQSMARLRGIHAQKTKHIDLFSNLPLTGVLVDEVITREELQKGIAGEWVNGGEMQDALEKHFLQSDIGVMPLRPSWLSKKYGYSESTIKGKCKLLAENPNLVYSYIKTNNLCFTTISYKRAGVSGAGSKCRALVSWNPATDYMSTAVDLAVDRLEEIEGCEIELLGTLPTQVEEIECMQEFECVESNVGGDLSQDDVQAPLSVQTHETTSSEATEDFSAETATYCDNDDYFLPGIPKKWVEGVKITYESEVGDAPKNVEDLTPRLTARQKRLNETIREKEVIESFNRIPSKLENLVNYLRSIEAQTEWVKLNKVALDTGYTSFIIWSVVTQRPQLFKYSQQENIIKLVE